jgi:hypothetical protein
MSSSMAPVPVVTRKARPLRPLVLNSTEILRESSKAPANSHFQVDPIHVE